MMKEIIVSKQNSSVKAWKKLLTTKGRKKSQSYLIEGTHLAQEAIKWQQPVKQWIMTERFYENHHSHLAVTMPDTLITLVSEAIMLELSATPSPQGVLAELEMLSIPSELPKGQNYLLIDGVQDPGNLGTMIRTADAAAYTAVILGEGTVDLFNDKVIRATQGSLWHLPIITLPLDEAIQALRQQDVKILATALNQKAISYKTIQTGLPLALIVGNEGNGVRQSFIELADESIYIPMPGSAESLNVGVAAGILMFHFVDE